MESDTLPDFDKKIVVLYVNDAPRAFEDGIVLEYASFHNQGGRVFVVGRIPEFNGMEDEWASTLQSAVAWDKVSHYIIFKSRQDYMQRVGRPRPNWFQKIMGY